MIYLLLGSDDFSKKDYIAELVAKEKAELCSFSYDGSSEQKKQIEQAINDNNLFGGRKLIRIFDYFASNTEGAEEYIQKISKTPNTVVFVEAKLDKRKSETKKLLGNKSIAVKEFNVPAGPEFKNWVVNRAKLCALEFESGALDLFLQRLGSNAGSFGEQIYSLWQADAEIKKLSAFSDGKKISKKDVENLVAENLDENIFGVTNAIGAKDKQLTLTLLENYLDKLGGDEKSKVISLSGLLGEQFRSILIVQDLIAQRLPDAEMSAQSGFASGRLFVYKKLALAFPRQKVLEAMRKLEALDEEVKTSSGPATLQLLMIIEGLVK